MTSERFRKMAEEIRRIYESDPFSKMSELIVGALKTVSDEKDAEINKLEGENSFLLKQRKGFLNQIKERDAEIERLRNEIVELKSEICGNQLRPCTRAFAHLTGDAKKDNVL